MTSEVKEGVDILQNYDNRNKKNQIFFGTMTSEVKEEVDFFGTMATEVKEEVNIL